MVLQRRECAIAEVMGHAYLRRISSAAPPSADEYGVIGAELCGDLSSDWGVLHLSRCRNECNTTPVCRMPLMVWARILFGVCSLWDQICLSWYSDSLCFKSFVGAEGEVPTNDLAPHLGISLSRMQFTCVQLVASAWTHAVA
jgi:hypothetical protein